MTLTFYIRLLSSHFFLDHYPIAYLTVPHYNCSTFPLYIFCFPTFFLSISVINQKRKKGREIRTQELSQVLSIGEVKAKRKEPRANSYSWWHNVKLQYSTGKSTNSAKLHLRGDCKSCFYLLLCLRALNYTPFSFTPCIEK